MYPDRLYDLALAFRKTKLWKSMYDSELFAVTLPNGQIGYCNVMGMRGEHISLSLNVGNEGLDDLRLLIDLYENEPNPLKLQEVIFGQSCLQCSFEQKDLLTSEELASITSYMAAYKITLRGPNAFPQFTRYRPARFPQPISSEEDIQLLCAALEAALAVHEKRKQTNPIQLGFETGSAYDRSIPLLTPSEGGFAWTMHPLPPKLPEFYPEPVLTDELLAARLKKAKKKNSVWVCDVIMIPDPCDPGDGTAPYFPYTLFYGSSETGAARSLDAVRDYKSEAETLLRELCMQMLEDGVPSELIVTDERTHSLLKNLAALLKIRLTLQPDEKSVDDIEMDFLSFIAGLTPPSPEEGEGAGFPILTDDILLSMPDEIFEQLLELAEQGVLDKDTTALLRRVAKQRT